MTVRGRRRRERGREGGREGGGEKGGRELLARTGMCSEYFDYWEMLLVLLVPAEHRWYESGVKNLIYVMEFP